VLQQFRINHSPKPVVRVDVSLVLGFSEGANLREDDGHIDVGIVVAQDRAMWVCGRLRLVGFAFCLAGIEPAT
jgi:hypothetical protein